jgi:hypothetical protein
LQILAFLWFSVSFFVFTLSATRFHHYILPGVPALSLLVGCYLVDLRRDTSLRGRLHVVLALCAFVAVVVNLAGDFQNLRNMFTYKYDRPLPENLPTDWSAVVTWPTDPQPLLTWAQQPFGKHVGPMVAHVLAIRWFQFDTFVKVVGALGGLALVGMLAQRLRAWALGLLAATAALTAFWALNWYMPALSPAWSQKYLFEAYYGDCHLHPNPPQVTEAYTPLVRKAGLGVVADFFDAVPKRVCEEDIVSWLITWRGETMYSNNEIRPLNKATQLEPYLREMNRGKTFYALLERGRVSGFESKVKTEAKKLREEHVGAFDKWKDWDCSLVGNDSAYFELAKCVPVANDGAPVLKPTAPARPIRTPGEAPADRSSSPNPTF